MLPYLRLHSTCHQLQYISYVASKEISFISISYIDDDNDDDNDEAKDDDNNCHYQLIIINSINMMMMAMTAMIIIIISIPHKTLKSRLQSMAVYNMSEMTLKN